MLSHSQAYSSHRGRRGKAFLFGVAALALIAVGGFAAYKYFFERPGEAASALIPADADVVVTLDTNPSERQIETFKKITNALQREGIAQKLDDTLKGFLEGKPVGSEIRPYLSRSFALGLWMQEGREPDIVTLCAVSDAAAVRNALEKHANARSGGIYVIPGTNDNVHATVIDSFLVLGGNAKVLERIEAVRSGRETSVTRLAEYNAARNALPADANVMVFISPQLFKELEKQVGAMPGIASFKGTQWMAYGATVEPEGIAFDYYCPMDSNKFKALKTVAGTKPFNMDSLKLLPEGAYGVAGYSQAGRYWDFLGETMAEMPDGKQAFDSGISEFEKETGLQIEADVVPAFQGEIVFAMYPGVSGKPEDFDGMLAITDSNGANPAQLAAKLRAVAERKSAKEGKPVHFTESKIGDVTVWEIDGASREQFARGIFEGMTSRTQPPKTMPHSEKGEFNFEQGPPPNVADDGTKAPVVKVPMPDEEVTAPPEFLDSKTVIYAQMGNSVVVCSSRALLTRAIVNRQSGKTLADEASFATMKTQVVEGSQAILLVNVRRLMEAFKPLMESGMKDGPFSADDFAGLFGDGLMGVVVSGKYDGNVAIGRFMLPLDFERCIHLMGSAMRGTGMGSEDAATPVRISLR